MALINGRIPTSMLTKVKFQKNIRLRKSAARSINRVRNEIKKKYGWDLHINSGYRSRASQVKVLKIYYDNTWRPGLSTSNGGVRYYGGRTWYRKPGYATAATPGYSNHGIGLAVDIANLGGFGGTRYKQFMSVAKKHGWSNSEGARIGEAWHHVYVKSQDRMKGRKKAGPRKRKPNRPRMAKMGSRGQDVKDWQRYLKNRGFKVGRIDGDFGPQTRNATNAWRKKRGLNQTGNVGRLIWFRAARGAKKGHRGPRVRIAQRILGLSGSSLDGVAGPVFVRQTKQMQRWLGVKRTGEFDRDTVKALRKKG